LNKENYGYCLLYPEEYVQVDTGGNEVCVVTEDFVFWESPCTVALGVADAAGRGLEQVVDERMVQIDFDVARSERTVGGVEAVVLDGVPGVDLMREVRLVHEDRMYQLTFALPGPDDPSAIERFERLYDTIIDSFTLVPMAPGPTEGDASGTAWVVYVKDGGVLAWDEASGQTQTIFDEGDATRVRLSDDGQLVAFLRGLNPTLWVIDRDGQNPRQLDEAQAMEWIPNSHRLLYTRSPNAYGSTSQGLTLMDVDTRAGVEIAGAEDYVSSMASPDGEYVALVSSTELTFVNVDESLTGQVSLVRPAGVSGPFCGGNCLFAGAWTQDSRAFLVKGSMIYPGAQRPGPIDPQFTIWRVPVDGTSAEPLITLWGGNEQFAPDGSVVTFMRWLGHPGASATMVLRLPDDLGPLSAPSDPFGLSMSPDGSVYLRGPEAMTPLCPSAAQAAEVCGPPVSFGTAIETLEWLDRERFLYVTYVPRRLMLGSLDGSAIAIADDPQDPLISPGNPSRASYDAVAFTCQNDAEFVSDVTVPDGTHLAPGEFFLKTWRLRNIGTCTWGDGYRFAFLAGDRLNGPRSTPLDAAVEPGGDIEVTVPLIAPRSAGTYRGQWTMFAPDGTPFGTRPYVMIVVP
jgi:hypothetical protein